MPPDPGIHPVSWLPIDGFYDGWQCFQPAAAMLARLKPGESNLLHYPWRMDTVVGARDLGNAQSCLA